MEKDLRERSAEGRNKSTVAKAILSRYGLILIFLVLIIIIASISPVFFSARNILSVLRQISVVGILAVGVTFVIISGGIDLSIGATASFAGVVAATIGRSDNLAFVAVLAGIGVGAACGAVNGFLIAKARVAPFIITLGTMTMYRGISLLFTDGKPVAGLSENYNVIGGGYVLGIPNPVLIFLLVILVGTVVLRNFKYGRHVVAVGGNELAAKISGVNTSGTVFGVYVIAGALAGLGGVVLTARLMAGPPTVGIGYELDAIAASVIGGTSLSGGIGTIPGAFLGALVVGVIKNGMDLLNVSGYYQQIVKGFIIILAVSIERQLDRYR